MKPFIVSIIICLIGHGLASDCCVAQEPASKQPAGQAKTGIKKPSIPIGTPFRDGLTESLAEPTPSTSSEQPTIKVTHEGRRFIGQPLAFDGKQLAMLRLDGELRVFPLTAKDKEAIEVVAPKFDPYVPSELKKRLKREFGNRYDISTTKNCVVVHPWGEPEYWAEPFEKMIKRFEDHFAKRKFELKDSKFTFIVIVLRSRKDFDRYMNNEIDVRNRSVAGFYSRLSNRMVTYDPSGLVRKPKQKSWLLTSTTMFHESAHQLAFNRGIHNRYSPPPLWLSEGFAMLFETAGTNGARLKTLREYYGKRQVFGQMDKLLTGDTLFQTDPLLAYSVSWGMANYLSKKNPKAFLAYLKEDSERQDFHVNPPQDRLKLFAKHFGNDIDQLQTNMRKHYN